MFKTDLEIAQECKMKNITEIGKIIDLSIDDLELYGKYKAKISDDVRKRVSNNQDGSLILVTAITPTKAGEGKSTVTIGLGEALNKLNKKCIVTLREPSLGPTLGLKGGAAGGGYAQVVPMEDLNLHFTGDIHAITAANNIISAALDNHIKQGNKLNIDLNNILWRRCLDLNDRALRTIKIGMGGNINGKERIDHFDITVASEIMAILCLSNDLDDLKERCKRIVIGYDIYGKIIYLDDLKCAGTVAVLLKDAIKPNLIQTVENTPAIVHGGPFANIAHGCNSVIATKLALKLAPYVVTEAGFGADLGAEKFLNIKCRNNNISPSCVCIVATIRALKMHGGVNENDLKIKNIEALKLGYQNLVKHILNIKGFNLPYVVAINKFNTDTEDEINTLKQLLDNDNHPYALCDVHASGGDGGILLANKVLENIKKIKINYTYDLNDSIETKVLKIATKIYGANNVNFSDEAIKKIEEYNKNGWDKLPICMAKTQYSFSDNPKLLGWPKDFTLNVKDFKISLGAGFIVCFLGDIMTMPGLPKEPALNNIDIIDGKIVGLF